MGNSGLGSYERLGDEGSAFLGNISLFAICHGMMIISL